MVLACLFGVAACASDSGARGAGAPAIGPGPAPISAAPEAGRGRDSPAASATRAPHRRPSPDPAAVATRLVIPDYEIDLPIVPDDLVVPGNAQGYPLCDVAQYLGAYAQPGEPGAVYLYGHAREGMLLPLLEASRRHDGRELIGVEASVYTDANRVYQYRIQAVVRHATDFALADSVRPGERLLVIQTSEGPHGTRPKLQLGASFVASAPADPRDARPVASPRACPP